MLKPNELAKEACIVGENKVNRKNIIVFVSAILGGLYIALGYYGFIVLSSNFVNSNYPILGTLLGAMVFPVGLILIIITGTDLFTGNCLIVFGWLDNRYHLLKIFKNLLIVYLGNFVGSLILVVLIYYSNLASSEVINSFIVNLSEKKVNLSIIEGIMRGILCNIAVVLAVYMSFAAKTVYGKMLAAYFPVLLFVLSGFEHSVANMFILPLGYIMQSDNSITLMGILKNLLPVTIGNFISGAILIPLPYYFLYLKDK